MSDPLWQRKTMVGQSGVGKLFAYVMFACFEAGVWPPGLFQFGLVFDVPTRLKQLLSRQGCQTPREKILDGPLRFAM